MHQLLRWANRREVARELTRRGFDVSGETLNRWVRDEREVPAAVERLVLEIYGLDAENQPPEPPKWAEGLARMSAEEAIMRLVPPDLLDAAQRLLALLEATPPQPDEAPPEGDGSQGRAAGAPR